MSLGKPSIWYRLKDWARQHKSKLLFALALVVVLGVGGGVWAFVANGQGPNIVDTIIAPKPAPPPPKPKSPLTGVEVADEATTKKQVTSFIIENSPDARPQSGLKEAGVIFEAIAEGGITRFLVLYQETRPGLVGPVRSLRPYYIDWLAAFDASIAHVGGSFYALQEIRTPGKYKDLDQFSNGAYFWRAKDRYAPHNVYTDFNKMDELNTKKGYTGSTFTGFTRKADQPAETPNVTSISVTISSALYNSTYGYDKASNTYVRSLAGKPHTDREAGQINPKVVVVMKVPMKLGFEDGWREQMTTIGSGEVYIFQDGGYKQGTWHKGDRKSQIQFKDSAGADIPLNAGQTWISVIPTEKSVTWQ